MLCKEKHIKILEVAHSDFIVSRLIVVEVDIETITPIIMNNDSDSGVEQDDDNSYYNIITW